MPRSTAILILAGLCLMVYGASVALDGRATSQAPTTGATGADRAAPTAPTAPTAPAATLAPTVATAPACEVDPYGQCYAADAGINARRGLAINVIVRAVRTSEWDNDGFRAYVWETAVDAYGIGAYVESALPVAVAGMLADAGFPVGACSLTEDLAVSCYASATATVSAVSSN